MRGRVVATILACLPMAARADQVFFWNQGQPTRTLVAASTNYCYLTHVGGKFRGFGERVRLRVMNGMWELGGASQQIDVSAWARCFARTEITSIPGAVRWSSEEISATAEKSGNGCVNTNPRDAWWGDAVTVMTLVTGAMRGNGERLTIRQSGDPFGPSQLILYSCQEQLGMGAYSFFVGKPQSGHKARFVGPGGIGTAGQAGDYASVANQNVLMAPVSKAFCYFTEVGGAWNGGGENVTILPAQDANGVNRWMLQARHASGTGVFARARCYARDQS